jgi:putative ABC transport system ATP-binding protein
VIENVALPLQLQGVRTSLSSARAGEMLALVGLEHRAKHFVHQLSGGEMQRTAVARALVHRPKLLLADEPTGNLDVTNADRLMEVFRKIASESLTTLVLVTHSVEVAGMAHREIRLRNGKVEEERLQFPAQ